jgi:hypothetical protein
MSLDYVTLDLLRQNHPAWRLLRSDHAPLVAGFLHRVFVAPNVRTMAQSDLAEALEDELFGLRERLGEGAFPKPALEYLNDWAGNDTHGFAILDSMRKLAGHQHSAIEDYYGIPRAGNASLIPAYVFSIRRRPG